MSIPELDFFAFEKPSPTSPTVIPSPDSLVAKALVSPREVINGYDADPRGRHFRDKFPKRDVDYMTRQLGPGGGDFGDLIMLTEPYRRPVGGGTVRVYLGSAGGTLSDDYVSHVSDAALGMFVDHDTFDEDGGSTFFHLFHNEVVSEDKGEKWNNRFMTGLLTIIELGSEIDATDQSQYHSFRQAIGATCKLEGC